MLLAPFFNAEFHDDDGTPLAGGFLHTYVSGTTTPQLTYTDATGDTENENPIELDAAGRCDLWLDPDLTYTFVLKRADLTTVKTWDAVTGAGASTVQSVNGSSGTVVVTADDLAFETSTATAWFVGSLVSTALDSIITQVDALTAEDVGAVAADIPITDAGNLYTSTNVEAALQEIGAKVPSQSGNSGKFLTTNGTTTSWGTAGTGTLSAASNGYHVLPSGLILQWGTETASGTVTFPLAFPTACLNCSATSTVNSAVTTVGSLTTTSFALGNVNTRAYWFAIGH